MNLETFYQSNILHKHHPVFLALEDITIDEKQQVPATYYFTFEKVKTPHDKTVDIEETDPEVVEAEQPEYILHASSDKDKLCSSVPLFFTAYSEIAGKWSKTDMACKCGCGK